MYAPEPSTLQQATVSSQRLRRSLLFIVLSCGGVDAAVGILMLRKVCGVGCGICCFSLRVSFPRVYQPLRLLVGDGVCGLKCAQLLNKSLSLFPPPVPTGPPGGLLV